MSAAAQNEAAGQEIERSPPLGCNGRATPQAPPLRMRTDVFEAAAQKLAEAQDTASTAVPKSPVAAAQPVPSYSSTFPKLSPARQKSALGH